MFKRIKEYFTKIEYIKPELDIVGLTRKQLGGVTLNILRDSYNDLDEQAKKDLCAEMDIIESKGKLKFIMDKIINQQANIITKQAKNETEMAFGRATINGLCLLSDEIGRLASIHRANTQKEEEFNKYNILGED